MAQQEGTIRSFVAEKRYGFIDGADGKSYFLHISGFAEPVEPENIVEDTLVTFTPTPTPKGLAARQVRVARNQAACWVRPDRFLFLKDFELRRCRILAQGEPIAVSGKDSPDEARRALADLAHSLGATAVLGTQYVKGTASNGNYQYTVHGYQGVPAVVMVPTATTDLKRIEQSERECDELILEFRDRYKKFQIKLRRERLFALAFRLLLWFVVVTTVFVYLST